ncbi:MAG: RidA family protein [Caulobacteraceae bacterium]|nr:RidA family protein [Caulobacteraceae bacterium]
MQTLLPEGWPRPRGYANGVAAQGRFVFVAGMIGWNHEWKFPDKDFLGQARRALEATLAVLREGGARPEHVCRMTWYVIDKREYLESVRELGVLWRDLFGTHYPAMAVVQVTALMEDEAKVEIETTAVVP